MHVTSLQAMKNEAVFRYIHLSLPCQQWGQLKYWFGIIEPWLKTYLYNAW